MPSLSNFSVLAIFFLLTSFKQSWDVLNELPALASEAVTIKQYNANGYMGIRLSFSFCECNAN